MQRPGKKILAQVRKMPPFPISRRRILMMTTDVNCPPRELLEAIHNDPILTLHILRQVNASEFGLKNIVTSPKQAAVVVGLNIVKNLAPSALDQKAVLHENADEFLNLLHRLAITTGQLARLLAHKAKLPIIELPGIQVAGLIYSYETIVQSIIGDEAHFEGYFERWKQHNRHKTDLRLQNAIFSCGLLGRMVAEAWHLPGLLQASLSGERPETDMGGKKPSPYDCVVMADAVARQWLFGLASKLPEPDIKKKFQAARYRDIMQADGTAANSITKIWEAFSHGLESER